MSHAYSFQQVVLLDSSVYVLSDRDLQRDTVAHTCKLLHNCGHCLVKISTFVSVSMLQILNICQLVEPVKLLQ
jgi:hypothetical protein